MVGMATQWLRFKMDLAILESHLEGPGFLAPDAILNTQLDRPRNGLVTNPAVDRKLKALFRACPSIFKTHGADQDLVPIQSDGIRRELHPAPNRELRSISEGAVPRRQTDSEPLYFDFHDGLAPDLLIDQEMAQTLEGIGPHRFQNIRICFSTITHGD